MKERPVVEDNQGVFVRQMLDTARKEGRVDNPLFRELLQKSDVRISEGRVGESEAPVEEALDAKQEEKEADDAKAKKLRGKNLGEFTLGDLIDAMNPPKAVRMDSRARLYQEWLGAGKQEQATVSKTYPPYKMSLVAIALDETLNGEGYTMDTAINFDWKDIESVVYKDLQVDLNKTRRILTEAHRFCKNARGEAFVVSNQPIWGGYKVTITTKHGLENIGSALIEKVHQWIAENNFLKNKKIKLDGTFLAVENKRWGDIVLPQDIKEEVQNNVIGMFDRRELYEANGIPFKRGVILEGPPGNGKTLLAKVLANELEGKSTFILATANDIEGASDVRVLYEAARELAPSVIFMEDLDAHGVDRAFGRVSPIVGEMLHQMDGIEGNQGIITLATTNYIGMVERALKDRPSRFDRVLKLDYPDAALREKLLAQYTDGKSVEEGALKSAAANTDGFSGSHMREVVNFATILAINAGDVDGNKKVKLTKNHFMDAIARMRKQKQDNEKVKSPMEVMQAGITKEATEEAVKALIKEGVIVGNVERVAEGAGDGARPVKE